MNQKATSLLQVIQERRQISVTALAQATNVPRTSLLRYLTQLEQEGFVVKTFGEVQLRQSNQESSAFPRLNAHRGAKLKIAAQAASIVRSRETIFLDGGSTTFYIAQKLANLQLTIYTNNLLISRLINADYQPEVFFVGGKVRKLTLVTASEQTMLDIRDLHFDQSFIGFNSLVDDWFATTNESEMILKRQIIKQTKSGQAFLVGRNEKSGAHAEYTFVHRQEVKLLTAEDEI